MKFSICQFQIPEIFLKLKNLHRKSWLTSTDYNSQLQNTQKSIVAVRLETFMKTKEIK